MTFIDFEEESIQDEIKRIQDIKNEYDNMSEEEKIKNTRSVKELLKDLEEDAEE